jgi:hypothetical protein
MNPRVQAVYPLNNYRLRLTFINGDVRVHDGSGLLDFGVFAELRDEQYFRRVTVTYGTVSWPHEQDICPDTLYEDSQPDREMPNKEMEPTG